MNMIARPVKRLFRLLLTFIPIIMALITAVFLHATGRDDDDIGFAFNNDSAVRLITQELIRQTIPLSIRSYGEVRAVHNTVVKAEVGGKVIDIHPGLEKGYRITRGELLLRIEDTEYQRQLAHMQEVLAEVRLAYEEEKARKAQAEEDLEKLPLELHTSLAKREPQLALAKARLDTAQAGLKLARQQLNRTGVVAPYDGYLVDRFVSPGDFLAQGDPLLSLYDDSGLLVQSFLSKSQITDLWNMLRAVYPDVNWEETSPDQVVSVKVADQWGSETTNTEATNVLFAASLDPSTRQQPVTLMVTPEIRRDGRELKPGGSVVTIYEAGELKDVYRLSLDSLSEIMIAENTALSKKQESAYSLRKQIRGRIADGSEVSPPPPSIQSVVLPFADENNVITRHPVEVVYQSATEIFFRLDNGSERLLLVTNPPVSPSDRERLTEHGWQGTGEIPEVSYVY